MTAFPEGCCDHCKQQRSPVVKITADGTTLYALTLCYWCVTAAAKVLYDAQFLDTPSAPA